MGARRERLARAIALAAMLPALGLITSAEAQEEAQEGPKPELEQRLLIRPTRTRGKLFILPQEREEGRRWRPIDPTRLMVRLDGRRLRPFPMYVGWRFFQLLYGPDPRWGYGTPVGGGEDLPQAAFGLREQHTPFYFARPAIRSWHEVEVSVEPEGCELPSRCVIRRLSERVYMPAAHNLGRVENGAWPRCVDPAPPPALRGEPALPVAVGPALVHGDRRRICVSIPYFSSWWGAYPMSWADPLTQIEFTPEIYDLGRFSLWLASLLTLSLLFFGLRHLRRMRRRPSMLAFRGPPGPSSYRGGQQEGWVWLPIAFEVSLAALDPRLAGCELSFQPDQDGLSLSEDAIARIAPGEAPIRVEAGSYLPAGAALRVGDRTVAIVSGEQVKAAERGELSLLPIERADAERAAASTALYLPGPGRPRLTRGLFVALACVLAFGLAQLPLLLYPLHWMLGLAQSCFAVVVLASLPIGAACAYLFPLPAAPKTPT